MAHVHTEPGQHDLTASAYIVLCEAGQEPRVWLHIHRKLEKWLQFGGHVELHENPWQAVAHEIKEESGYELSRLQVLQPKLRVPLATDSATHPQPACLNTHKFRPTGDHYHIDVAFAFVATHVPLDDPDDGESNTLQAFTADEIKQLPEDMIAENTRITALFVLGELLANWEAVDTAAFTLK